MKPDALVQLLRERLGDSTALLADGDAAPYLSDLLGRHQGAALCVVRPHDTAEVATTVQLAAAHGVAVTPAGGRTGFCGGAVPAGDQPHIVLSLERMRRIRSLDTINDVAIVEAGCTLAEIRRTAEEVDRFFPVSHGGEGTSQIGGMIATNAGGNNVLRYGMARSHILGIEVVLPDGTVWDGLRVLRKDNAGYDLKQLFIGAEGTLGIVTAAALALRQHPIARAAALAALPDPQAALDLFVHLRRRTGELLSAFELMPRSGLDLHLVRPGAGPDPFAEPHCWLVLIELETTIPALDLTALLEGSLADALERALVRDAAVAQSESQREAFWALREGMAEAQASNPRVLKSDTSVPLGASPDFVRHCEKAVGAIAPGAVSIPFGHIGDGNIHFNVLAPEKMETTAFSALAPRIAEAIQQVALSLGGSISAEHGLGQAKRDSAAAAKPQAELDLMRRIKQAIDPQDRMNPGKVVRQE